jgi:hypothetical protein
MPRSTLTTGAEQEVMRWQPGVPGSSPVASRSENLQFLGIETGKARRGCAGNRGAAGGPPRQ